MGLSVLGIEFRIKKFFVVYRKWITTEYISDYENKHDSAENAETIKVRNYNEMYLEKLFKLEFLNKD